MQKQSPAHVSLKVCWLFTSADPVSVIHFPFAVSRLFFAVESRILGPVYTDPLGIWTSKRHLKDVIPRHTERLKVVLLWLVMQP